MDSSISQVISERIDQSWSILFLIGHSKDFRSNQKIDNWKLGSPVPSLTSIGNSSYLFRQYVTFQVPVKFHQVLVDGLRPLPLFEYHYESELLGQQFTAAGHLWGRIMNIDVSTFINENGNALMYAVPSNLSLASPEYERLVAERVARLRAANPAMEEAAIPVDLVTCSGSGLDPHISPAAAEFQVARIAGARGMTEDAVREVIHRCTKGRFLGVFGEETVNVMKVNPILDGMLK